MNEDLRELAPGLINICAMPGNFAKAIGYNGQADLLGVWWEMCGDELAWCDGISTMVGANFEPYLKQMVDQIRPCLEYARKIITFPKTNKGSELIDLGGSDHEATWWLILDLKNNDIYAAKRNQAQALLKAAAGDVIIEDLEPVVYSNPYDFGHSVLCSSDEAVWLRENLTGLEKFTITAQGIATQLCNCFGGWLFDADLFEWQQHELCQGKGYVVASQLKTG